MMQVSPDKAKYLKHFHEWMYEHRLLMKETIGENTVYESVLTDYNTFLRRVEYTRHIFDYADSHHKEFHNILDYGCGWGYFVFVLSIFEEGNYWGIDIREQEVQLAEKIRQDVFKNKNINFIHSPALCIHQSYDVVYFNNVLSHVKIPLQQLFEATRALSYGGTLLIYDNNNGLSLFVRLRNKLLWKNDEKYLSKERLMLIEHEGINGPDAQSISVKTNGLDRHDLELLLRTSSRREILEYVSHRSLTDPSQMFDPPIVNERVMNPRFYKKILGELGFEEVKYKASSYNHYFLCEHFNLFGLLIFLFPAFILRATRRKMFL
jgi:2-polyprenyl-3-methyl-5-hydroxy-6-metoxy-1,4-benzoquinol methylase